MNNNYIFLVKKGAVGTKLEATLSDENGAVDLTGCTVYLITTPTGQPTRKIDDGICTLAANQTSTGKGKIWYTFSESDLDTVGNYDVEFKVEFSDGSIRLFPTNDSSGKMFGTIKVLKSK